MLLAPLVAGETVVGLNLRAGEVIEFYPFSKEAKEMRATLLDSATIGEGANQLKASRSHVC